MEDTPQHIKDLQLKIWLAKPPMERLRQFLIDNEQFYRMIEHAKKRGKKKRKLRINLNVTDRKHELDKWG